MTTITQRVDGAITADLSKRVATTGAGLQQTGRTWGNTWGNTWGKTWGGALVLTGEAPTLNVTLRVTGAPSGGITKRI